MSPGEERGFSPVSRDCGNLTRPPAAGITGEHQDAGRASGGCECWRGQGIMIKKKKKKKDLPVLTLLRYPRTARA